MDRYLLIILTALSCIRCVQQKDPSVNDVESISVIYAAYLNSGQCQIDMPAKNDSKLRICLDLPRAKCNLQNLRWTSAELAALDSSIERIQNAGFVCLSPLVSVRSRLAEHSEGFNPILSELGAKPVDLNSVDQIKAVDRCRSNEAAVYSDLLNASQWESIRIPVNYAFLFVDDTDCRNALNVSSYDSLWLSGVIESRLRIAAVCHLSSPLLTGLDLCQELE